MDTGSCGALSYPPLKTFLQKGRRRRKPFVDKRVSPGPPSKKLWKTFRLSFKRFCSTEKTTNFVGTDVLGGPSYGMNIKPRKNPQTPYPRSRGSNRSKFPPSKTEKSLPPNRLRFSVFAVLFEAAKAEFFLFRNRVRISRCGASALAREIGGT